MQRFEVLLREGAGAMTFSQILGVVEAGNDLDAVRIVAEQNAATPQETHRMLVEAREPYFLVAVRTVETGEISLVHLHPLPGGDFEIHRDTLIDQPDPTLGFPRLSMN